MRTIKGPGLMLSQFLGDIADVFAPPELRGRPAARLADAACIARILGLGHG